MQLVQCAAGVVEPALGAAAELGRWLMDVVVLPVVYGYSHEEAALGKHSAQSTASV